jgi:hypothetical protein
MKGLFALLSLFVLVGSAIANSQEASVTISSNPSPATICAGNTIVFTATVSAAGGPFTYKWKKNGTIVKEESSDLQNTSSYDAVGLANGDVITCDVTNDGADVPGGNSITVTVITVAAPTAVSPQSFCVADGKKVSDLTASGSNLKWYSQESGGAALDPASILTSGTYYVSQSDGSCESGRLAVAVVVNPNPALTSTKNPAAICSGVAFNYTATSDITGTSFSWTRAQVAGISNSAGNGSQAVISETLLNTTSNPVDVVYVFTLTANSCSTVENITLTVRPTPVLSSATTANRCSGVSTTYTATSATAGTTFAWSRAVVSGISNAAGSGTGAAITETLVNTTAAPVNVSYAITLTANGCANTQNVVVTVNPTPVLTSAATGTRCSGVSTTYTATSATTGTTFSWSRAAVSGISNAANTGTGAAITEILVNTTPAPVNITYVVTLTANGCSNTQNVVITVNPTPALSSTLTPTAICSTNPFAYTPTSATTGATYSWTRAAVTGITPATSSGTGGINESLTNSTVNPVDVTYVYVTSANGCSNSPGQNVVVRLNPSPVLSSTLTPPAVCSGTPFNYSPTSATVGSTFTWSRATVAGITPAGPVNGSGTISESLSNSTTAPVSVSYSITTAANGCSSTQAVPLVVNPIPRLSSTLTPAAVCSGLPFSYTPTSATSGSVFSWSRAAITNITPAGPTNGTGTINETLSNSTAAGINVTYRVVTSANNCTNTGENVVVAINALPVAPTMAGLSGTVCQFTLNQNFSASSNSPGVRYNWTATGATINAQTTNPTNPVTNTPAGQNAIISFRTAGSATIGVTATFTATGCVSTPATTRTITVTAGAPDTAKVIYNGSDFVALNNTVSKYQWGYDSVNLVPFTISGETFQNYFRQNAIPETSKFAFWVRTEKGSCFTKSYFNTPPNYTFRTGSIIPPPAPEPDILYAIQLSPNPARGMLTVAWNSTQQPTDLFITDATGRRALARKLPDSGPRNVTVNVARLQAGIYFVQLFQNGKKGAIARFVKD